MHFKRDDDIQDCTYYGVSEIYFIINQAYLIEFCVGSPS
jgi:hypothetical protein